MTPPIWSPILDGALAQRARDTIRAVAQDLRASLPSGGGDASLASGRAGMAIFFAYLAKADPDSGHAGLAEQLLDEATEAMAGTPMTASLYGGLPGHAW